MKNCRKSDEIYEKLIDDRIEIGTPVYSLLEYRAEINMKGGFGLQKDAQMAAELYEPEFKNPRIENFYIFFTLYSHCTKSRFHQKFIKLIWEVSFKITLLLNFDVASR